MSFVRRFDYPFAIKIAAGKINAVTGEPWKDGLSDAPQDYVVVPGQPWLDGFAISEGLIRQFVAMPLGEGYTAEGQITGKEEFGGLQIAMYPMTPERFAQYIADKVSVESAIVHDGGFDDMYFASMDSADALIGGSAGEVRFRSCEIGLAPGGLMRQEIYEDPYGVDAWDQSAISRCFVHIVNSNAFHDITGRRPPTKPPTASQYKAAGIPWFDYWDKEAKSLKGSKILAMLDSVATKKVREGKPVAEPQIDVGKPVQIGSRKPQVRDGKF